MLTVEFTNEELAYLRRVLLSEFSELRSQISNTDTMEFREQLQRDESMLRELILGLGGQLPGEVPVSESSRVREEPDEGDAEAMGAQNEAARRPRRLIPRFVRVTRVRLGPARRP